MWRKSPKAVPRWIITLTVVGAVVWSAGVAHAGLYECRGPSGLPIYTDSPAQLERCQPVVSGGTSRLGLVGGTTPSTAQAPQPVNSLPSPEAPAPTSSDPGSAAMSPAGGLAGETSDTPPCTPSLNPLNPFSGPPCDTTSITVPPTPTTPSTATVPDQPHP